MAAHGQPAASLAVAAGAPAAHEDADASSRRLAGLLGPTLTVMILAELANPTTWDVPPWN